MQNLDVEIFVNYCEITRDFNGFWMGIPSPNYISSNITLSFIIAYFSFQLYQFPSQFLFLFLALLMAFMTHSISLVKRCKTIFFIFVFLFFFFPSCKCLFVLYLYFGWKFLIFFFNKCLILVTFINCFPIPNF